jgi:hypothetical protein
MKKIYLVLILLCAINIICSTEQSDSKPLIVEGTHPLIAFIILVASPEIPVPTNNG